MIDPYGPDGMALLTGFTKRINGEPRESCTSAEMKLGWDKADEAVTHGIAQPKPPLARRLRAPAAVAMGVFVLATGSYALLAHRNAAEPAPVVATSYIVPDLTSPAVFPTSDMGHNFHVVVMQAAEPSPPPMTAAIEPTSPPVAVAVAPEPSIVSDTPEQLRVIEDTRRLVARWHTEATKVRRGRHIVAPLPETAAALLRQGDALLEAGDVAAARSLYGRAAEDGTSAIAVQAADRLNQLDAR